MTTDKFNLIDEAWLPVLMKDGTCRRVSLREVFDENGGGIADLSLVAYERISVMRFLICLALAAFEEGELKDEAAWKAARGKLCPRVNTYLDKWHDRFNFFGEHAFMQPDGLTSSKPSGIEKLFPHRASGNNGTLFDHAVLSSEKNLMAEDWPIGMLTYLNYAAGGQHPKCVWSGVETSVSVTAGPSREKSMVQTFTIGELLAETVWLNLITDQMVAQLPSPVLGRPFWECADLQRDTIKSPFGVNTLLGRLVPLSRVMKFLPECEQIPLGEGLKYVPLPESREPMAAVYLKKGAKKDETVETYVSASPEEMPWRNLQAVLSRSQHCGTLTLRHLDSLASDAPERVISLWCGGLVGDQAKNVAVVEWRTALQIGTITDYHLAIYQNGVDFAKEVSDNRIDSASKAYCEAMKIDMKDPVKVDSVARPVRRLFWDALNRKQTILQELAFAEKGRMDDWTDEVCKTAREAFKSACPHATGRQLEAFAKGLAKLYFKKEN